MKTFRHNLHQRFTVLMLVAALLVGFVISVWSYRSEYAQAVQDSSRALEAMVQSIEKTAAIAAYNFDETLANELMAGLRLHPQVAIAQVLFNEGELRDSEEQAFTISRQLKSPFPPHDVVGRLILRANKAAIQAQATARARAQAISIAIQTALITLVLYVAAGRFVSRPIVKLADGVAAIEPGSSQRLPPLPNHESDELGMLVDGTNQLLQSYEGNLQRERELRREVEVMEAQYRQIFDSTSAGIFVLDNDGRLINSNPTVERLVGSVVSQGKGQKGQDFVVGVFKDPERAWSLIDRARECGETMSADLELVHAGAAPRWVHCLISVQHDHNNEVRQNGLVEGVVYDITERHKAEAVTRHRAEYDGLTGLNNRHSTEHLIDQMALDAKRLNKHACILCIDLDGFKRVNDTYGHHAGDYVLRVCAQRMLNCVRRGHDLVGRMGGDEFVVALANCAIKDAAVGRTAEALISGLSEPITLADDQGTVAIGASIGIASTSESGFSREGLLAAADCAMYEVKRTGKNTYATALPDVFQKAAVDPLN